MRLSHKGTVLLAAGAISAVALSACAGKTSTSSSSSASTGSSSSSAMTGTSSSGGMSSSSGSAPGGTGGSGGTLTYGADQFPSNWNPDINAGNGTATANGIVRILPSVYYTNPQFKEQYDPELLTAEPSVTSQNPFTVTYKLNPKAVWSDGTPINSDDFAFNWQVNNPMNQTYYAKSLGANVCTSIVPNYNLVKSVTGSADKKTVTVTFTAPFADWQSLFSTLIPAHIFKQSTGLATCKAFNAGWDAKKVLPISGGPWMMQAVDATKQTFTLVPNTKYWGTKPKLSKLIYDTIPSDANSLQNAMQNGEVGLIYPQPELDLVTAIKKVQSVNSGISYGLSFEHLDYNTQNQYLKDEKFRQAISMAINRSDIVKATIGQFSNQAKVLNNRIFVNNQPGYQDNSGGMYDKANLDAAKKLLKDDGYSFSGGKLKKGGTQVSLRISTTANNALRATTEQIVQQDLDKLGIKMTIKNQPASVFFGGQGTTGSISNGDFDIALYAWVATPFLTSNYTIYHSVPGNNRANEAQNAGLGGDPKVDALMAQGQGAIDPAKAITIWNKVDKQLWTDMFTYPLFQKPTFIAYNKKYTGITDNSSSQGPFWNSDTWSEAK